MTRASSDWEELTAGRPPLRTLQGWDSAASACGGFAFWRYHERGCPKEPSDPVSNWETARFLSLLGGAAPSALRYSDKMMGGFSR
jgi:hypothetical protein